MVALVSCSSHLTSAFLQPTTRTLIASRGLNSKQLSSGGVSKRGVYPRDSVFDRRCPDARKGFQRLPSCSSDALFSSGSDNTDHSRTDKELATPESGRVPGHLRILGVCGGIGSGKSLACRILVSDLGCAAHIDADKLSHGVYTPGNLALKEISEEFGSDILQESGEIDRKKLGGIVFSDPKFMSKLEGIVWPHARALLETRLEELDREFHNATSTSLVIVEAAVLIDAGWDDLFDAVWVVQAPATTTTDRLISDRGMDGPDATIRIDAQQSRRGIGNLQEEVEKGTVTAVIENNGTIDALTTRLAEKLSNPLAWKNRIPFK